LKINGGEIRDLTTTTLMKKRDVETKVGRKRKGYQLTSLFDHRGVQKPWGQRGF